MLDNSRGDLGEHSCSGRTGDALDEEVGAAGCPSGEPMCFTGAEGVMLELGVKRDSLATGIETLLWEPQA